jgi:hypothetical protein
MSNTQKLIIAFWIIVGFLLLWQFYSYNQGLTQQAIDSPQQKQFWYTNAMANPHPGPTAPVVHDHGAYVEQTAYTVEENSPGNGNFTIHVTLKNVGNAKATGVQIHVRPYRGMRLGNEDAGNSPLTILDDDAPLSQFGQWVDFPDLAPGESSTQSVVFLDQPNATPVVPGVTPTGVPGQAPKELKPEIVFSSEKSP